MDYLSALGLTHRILEPANYCELGCRRGASLALSSVPAIGVDPNYEIVAPLAAPTRLFRSTGDAFFARSDIAGLIAEPIDLALIGDVRPLPSVLRNFINLERFSAPTSIIAIAGLSAGDEDSQHGDVAEFACLLRRHRPDLDVRTYDIGVAGFALISRLDPSSTTLGAEYARIERQIADERGLSGAIELGIERSDAGRLTADLEELARRRRGQSAPQPSSTTALYLELLKKSVLNEIYLDDELRLLYLRRCVDGEERFDQTVLHDIRGARKDDYLKLAIARHWGQFVDHDIRHAGFAHSMMGRVRLDNLHHLMDQIRTEGLQGDFIECGVWRGGGCIFMAGYLLAHGMADRKVFVADSFQGLPRSTHANDLDVDLSKEKAPELAVSLDTVRGNFTIYGLDRPNVVFLKGWFKDTLLGVPTDRIALLRMDGDLYESTMDTLLALYDRVVSGGGVIVDDYNAVPACRQAVADFFRMRGLPQPEMQEIDWAGVWFRKP